MTGLRDLAGSIRGGMADRWSLMRLCMESSRSRTAGLLGGAVLGGIFPTVIILATSSMVAALGKLAGSGGLGSTAGHKLIAALVIAAVAVLLSQTVTATRRLIAELLARTVSFHLRRRAMAVMSQATRLAELGNPHLADAVSDVAYVEIRRPLEPAIIGVADALASRLSAFGPLIIVAVFRWWLALALAVTWTSTRAFLGLQNRRRVSVLMGQSNRLRAADYFRDMATAPGLAKEIRIFGLAGWVTDRFRNHWSKVMAEMWAERGTARLPLSICAGMVTAVNVLAYVYLVARAHAGEVPLGQATAVAQSVLGSASIAGLAGMHGVDQALVPVRAVRTLETKCSASSRVMTGTPAAGRPQHAIKLTDVSFRYRASAEDSIGPITLEIPAGSTLGVVGANGAGKTTLASIIMGLYPPSSGQVLVDGTDLESYDLDSWWSNIGVLFQNFGRYPVSLASNIRYGSQRSVPDAESDPALRSMIAKLGLDELSGRLANGWQTPLSRVVRGGVDLSGGQWQRVALARALAAARGGARLIVLDEPTSQLDARAEVEFFENYLELRGNATSILISHRFPAVRGADLIVVLDRGQIVQRGSHAELIAQPGPYRSMFDMQAAAYRH